MRSAYIIAFAVRRQRLAKLFHPAGENNSGSRRLLAIQAGSPVQFAKLIANLPMPQRSQVVCKIPSLHEFPFIPERDSI
jgi:hypothetical protein